MARALDFLLDDAPASAAAAGPSKKAAPSTSTPSNKRRKVDLEMTKDQDQGDFDVDITRSLLGPATASKPTTGKGKTKAKGKGLPIGDEAAKDDEDDGDAEFIAGAQQRHNVKAGTEVAKRAVKGKGKADAIITGGAKVTGGGSFQSMGLHPSLLRSLLVRGFTTPTPIQRQAIPSILSQPPRDLVGMARTGSGKTLAYIIPLIQRLNGRHSTTFGIKSIILCPSRELALQIMKVGKEIARGWKPDSASSSAAAERDGQDAAPRGEAIRWGLVVGGESLDENFALIASNPDVLIATPGRLLHLIVEMNLDLSSVNYVVFDEADRLFEMGFAAQLEELLLRLPPSRQTLLFSATLPKSLVEFARAGLQANPKLVRLDADAKISADLRMAFFSVKPSEKEAALLVLLRTVIGVPFGEQAEKEDESIYEDDRDQRHHGGRRKPSFSAPASRDKGWGSRASGGDKKRKRTANDALGGAARLLPHQTIIFCATKHHVEYLTQLLSTCGYACSHIYSSLDQTARTIQMARFRRGQTSLLIVTDVAARGIDLPVLEHVINYDFCSQPRVFVHRVGRTARAGRKGWAYSFVTNTELPYLCDLQLFLARPLVPSGRASKALVDNGADADAGTADMHTNLVLGTFSRHMLDPEVDFLEHSLTSSSSAAAQALPALKQVAARAQGMYERSRSKASQESHRRAKEMVKAAQEAHLHLTAAKSLEPTSLLLAGCASEELGVHEVLRNPAAFGFKGMPIRSDSALSLIKAQPDGVQSPGPDDADMDAARAAMLAKINGFTPMETIFEAGRQGANPLAQLMKSRRQTLQQAKSKDVAARAAAADDAGKADDDAETKADSGGHLDGSLSEADEEDLKDVFDLGGVEEAGSEEEQEQAPNLSTSARPLAKGAFRDPNFYMSYKQEGADSEKGYSFSGGGSSFNEQARHVTFDLNGDDATLGTQTQRPNAARWDTKKKKFIKGDGTGSDNKRLIRTESGLKLPATFRSGRFDEWKREQRLDMPKVGEREADLPITLRSEHMRDGRRLFKHTKTFEAKPVDRLSDKWSKNSKNFTAKEKAQHEEANAAAKVRDAKGTKGKYGSGKKVHTAGAKRNSGTKARSELRSARDIQKERAVKQKRREKNARPPSKKGKGAR
ncbi:DEAD-domain-containing protein [Tilletiaria anomala UBC 951]|uniref:RNA helicase n=1 Tax=Tilletiaria anomala (strain ATCC 24038 / CBS 436.72 / UBC 951) TaxID=1037660 RepID=A0A066VLS4_TILAU|nr:DEAD-domain-containing protein [Tilletiaria anomala UBC 951]KDN42411.1 DEAD-domain-containing protein [Tilletiaria anomala UBC 951]